MNSTPRITPEILDALADLQVEDDGAALHIDTIQTVNRWLLGHIEQINAPAEDVAGMVLDLMTLADRLRILGDSPTPIGDL